MKVALGTYEVTEEERRAIKRAIGFKAGKASRDEARAFILGAVEAALDRALFPDPEDRIARIERAQEES